jgi:hypothetical protein
MFIFIILISLLIAECAMIAVASMPYVIPMWATFAIEVVYMAIHVVLVIYVVNLQDDMRFYKRKWEEEKCRRD